MVNKSPGHSVGSMLVPIALMRNCPVERSTSAARLYLLSSRAVASSFMWELERSVHRTLGEKWIAVVSSDTWTEADFALPTRAYDAAGHDDEWMRLAVETGLARLNRRWAGSPVRFENPVRSSFRLPI